MGRTGIYPYYHGQHRWDNYLLDIQDAVEKNSDILREQTEEMQEQTEELRRQTEELGNIRAGIEGMREEMQLGFMLVVDRMNQQAEMFSKAVARLCAIHETLKSPLMTQANELLKLGLQWEKQGLLDEAREAYLQSEQKNEVNFLLQLSIGMLFLGGTNRQCNVIDVGQAEKHLRLAQRYARAAEKTEPNWKRFCADACYHAGTAAYVSAEQHEGVGDLAGRQKSLEQSLDYLTEALKLRPEFTACIYCQGKCYALLGRKAEALERFRVLADRNRDYSQILQDKDLDDIRPDIQKIFQSAVDNPGLLAISTAKNLNKADAALAWAKRVQANATRFEPYLRNAHQLLRSFDVNIEVLNRGLIQAVRKLETITEEAFRVRQNGLESEISSLAAAKSQAEQAIQNLQREMAQGGTGLGCLFAFGAFSLALFAVNSVFAPILNSMLHQHVLTSTTGPLMGLAIMLTMLGTAVVGFFVGRSISRSRKNQPYQSGIQQQITLIASYNNRMSILTQQIEAARTELQQFLTWRESTRSSAKSSSAG